MTTEANSLSLTEFWGEPISVYTEEDALRDGTLVEVTDTAREAGFSCRYFLTRAAWEDFAEWTPQDEKAKGGAGQSVRGRLWDVVWMSKFASSRANVERGYGYFKFSRVPRPGRGRQRVVTAKIVFGGTFNGEPSATVMLPNDPSSAAR